MGAWSLGNGLELRQVGDPAPSLQKDSAPYFTMNSHAPHLDIILLKTQVPGRSF